MPKIRSGLSKEPDSCALWQEVIIEQVKEALIGQTPFDHQLKDTIVRIKKKNNELSRGARFVHGTKNVFNCFGEELENYINDPRLKGIIQHESRAHMRSDLLRYFLVSLYGKINQKSPRLTEWSGKMKLLKPKHSNIKIKQNSLSTKAHNDRFKVQIWDAPSSTIVSHIAKDGHYFIHPDTTQCRSFTVREAARLQTFPDNYYFFGNKTQQYHQVGNAVPVILARKIAETIKASLN